MSLSAPEVDPPRLEVRDARASSVIVQRVPAERTDAFLEWQRGITRAAAAFPGYRGDRSLSAGRRRAGGLGGRSSISTTPTTLQDWIDSPERAEWVAKLPGELGDFRLKTLPAGFGAWFAGQSISPRPSPRTGRWS